MYNTDSQILEAQVVIRDYNTITSSTSGGLLIEGGISALDTYVRGHVAVNDVKITPNIADIIYEKQFELVNTSESWDDITDLFFINSICNGFKLHISVISSKNSFWEINGVLANDEWVYNASFTGDLESGVDFKVIDAILEGNNVGQIQYKNNNIQTVTIRYRAETLGKENHINVSTENILINDKIASYSENNFYYADSEATFQQTDTLKYINDNFIVPTMTGGNITATHIIAQELLTENLDNLENLHNIDINSLLVNSITTSNCYVENITSDNLIINDELLIGDINKVIPEWATRIGTNSFDQALSIDVSKLDGSVYITGYFGASGSFSVFNSDGTITLNTFGSLGSNDAFIVKYNSSGLANWVTRVGGLNSDVSNSISLSSSDDNIYITGEYFSNPLSIYNSDGTTFGTLMNTTVGSADAFIIKYNNMGIAQWATRLGGMGDENSLDVSVTSDGENIYIAGSFSSDILHIYNSDGSTFGTLNNTLSGTIDIFYVKYNNSGFVEWVLQAGNTTNMSFPRIAVSADKQDVYIVGSYDTGTLTLYNSDGTVAKTNINSQSEISGDIYIAKYNSLGFYQWSTFIISSRVDFATGIQISDNGNIYICSTNRTSVTLFNSDGTAAKFINTRGLNDAVISKYNSLGFLQWASYIAGGSDDVPRDLFVTTDGSVYVTGEYRNLASIYNSDDTIFNGFVRYGTTSNNNQNAFFVKYDSNGMAQFAGRLAHTSAEVAFGITVALDESIYICGYYFSGLDIFDTDGFLMNTIGSIGSGDAFVVKYIPDLTNNYKLNVRGESNIIGNTELNGVTNLHETLTITNNLNITAGATLNFIGRFDGYNDYHIVDFLNSLQITGNTTFNNNVNITNSNLDVGNELGITGASTLNGSVNINNNLGISGALTITEGSLFNGSVNIRNTLTVTGGAVFVNDVTTGSINVNGNVFATGSISQASDVRLKRDISTIESALDKTNGLRGVYYTHRDSDKRSIGVIAQETELVLPEVVKEIGEYKSVEYGNIYGLLIEAVKELDKQINNKLEKIENQLNLM
jgi:hypothetical protein